MDDDMPACLLDLSDSTHLLQPYLIKRVTPTMQVVYIINLHIYFKRLVDVNREVFRSGVLNNSSSAEGYFLARFIKEKEPRCV